MTDATSPQPKRKRGRPPKNDGTPKRGVGRPRKKPRLTPTGDEQQSHASTTTTTTSNNKNKIKFSTSCYPSDICTSLQNVFSKHAPEWLSKLAEKHHIQNEENLVEALVRKSLELGIKSFAASLPTEIMKQALTQARKFKAKKEIKTQFIEALNKLGVEYFLSLLNKELLMIMTEALNYIEDGASTEQLVDSLLEEIALVGLREVLDQMRKEDLFDMATAIKCKVNTGHNKKLLVAALLMEEFPHLEETFKGTEKLVATSAVGKGADSWLKEMNHEEQTKYALSLLGKEVSTAKHKKLNVVSVVCQLGSIELEVTEPENESSFKIPLKSLK